jgi:hypothetical protein
MQSFNMLAQVVHIEPMGFEGLNNLCILFAAFKQPSNYIFTIAWNQCSDPILADEIRDKGCSEQFFSIFIWFVFQSFTYSYISIVEDECRNNEWYDILK